LVWTSPKDLGAVPLAPLALAGGPARLLVATRSGTVHALADDGTTLWSGPVADGSTLRGSNVSAPSSATPVTSTAYLSAANGKVYAVVVDGTLDAAAPWPKAFHDRRNTSRAGAAP
jgi:outer membrane protein assembly factor BamB